MSLSCYANEGDGEWWYYAQDDYYVLNTQRGRRCCSCKAFIRPLSIVLKFTRERVARGYVEERIYGDEVPMRDWFMCETCADLFFSLEELGYCITIGEESMRELVQQHHEIQGEARGK